MFDFVCRFKKLVYLYILNNNNMEKMIVAKTIYAQIGGQSFYMMGAKNFIGGDNTLSFQIAGCKAYSHIRVALSANDTYNVTFYKIVKCEIRNEVTIAGVYVDQLHKTIEENTKLYLKL